MRASRIMLAVSVAAAVSFLLATSHASSDSAVALKVGSIVLLAAVGFDVDKLLGSALAISAVGDFLLGVPRLGSLDGDKLFLLGLGSFLIAHVFYIAMFRRYRRGSNAATQRKPHSSKTGLSGAPGTRQRKPPLKQKQLEWGTRRKLGPTRLAGIAAILIVLASMLAALWNSLGPLLIPVVIYAFVLCTMGISAMLADLGNPLAAIGALSFIASDAMLAISRFRAPFAAHEPLIWITYYAAQLLILLGVLNRRRDPAVRR